MTRMIRADMIVTLNHAAEKLGLESITVQRWRDRRNSNGFPHPLYKYGKNVEVYDFLQVWAWHRDWQLNHRENNTRITP